MGLKAVATLVPGGGAPVGGSGTPGKLAKFTGAGTSIGDSLLSESGTTITSAATAQTFGSAQTWTLAAGTTALNIASNLLNLDTTNSRVGIGTASPVGLLNVRAALNATNLNLTSTTEAVNSYVELRLSSGDATGIYPNRAALIRGYTAAAGTDQNELAFFTASSAAPAEAMRITYDKRVGIGTASPGAKLALLATPTATVPAAAAGTVYSGVFCGGDASGTYGVVLGLLTSGAGYLQAQQRTGPAVTYDFLISPNGGNVGIGIGAGPTAALHLPAGATARASLKITSGVAPTAPNNGDIWFDGTNIFMRVGGVTKTFTLV